MVSMVVFISRTPTNGGIYYRDRNLVTELKETSEGATVVSSKKIRLDLIINYCN